MKVPSIAFASVVIATAAFAQEAAPDASPAATPPAKKGAPTEERFQKFDADKDGNLTLEEFSKGGKDAAKSEASFKKRDKNSDGKLTLDEYLAK